LSELSAGINCHFHEVRSIGDDLRLLVRLS
jgi:hypothetical protein